MDVRCDFLVEKRLLGWASQMQFNFLNVRVSKNSLLVCITPVMCMLLKSLESAGKSHDFPPPKINYHLAPSRFVLWQKIKSAPFFILMFLVLILVHPSLPRAWKRSRLGHVLDSDISTLSSRSDYMDHAPIQADVNTSIQRVLHLFKSLGMRYPQPCGPGMSNTVLNLQALLKISPRLWPWPLSQLLFHLNLYSDRGLFFYKHILSLGSAKKTSNKC